ncbi:glycosyltransferase family 4 protein [Brevibacterium gallinarum]|uniref:Glycosyltransferase family 4 protein n=1 Tax=Brevibacterium gallinarum TaxID=2762220 RepID=A0ABR8WUE1_9MICO|nr:glycosyltransferase family 4 protein [Brevibacterium gallinarum]MBD8020625.1 glycosyltransferase family 4 protein [Brevibacterium gallinarum]
MSSRPVHLVEPALGRASGGARYNRAVTDAAAGQIALHAVPGSWPAPTAHDEARVHALLTELEGPVVLDGLLGCALSTPPEHDGPLLQLVHLPRGRGGGEAFARERACLHAADGIIVTSQHAAGEIAELYGLGAAVARPGTVPRPFTVPEAAGTRLLCLASVEERKNQLLLARALADVTEVMPDAGLRCVFAGPITEPDYAEQLREALAGLPAGSWEITGELDASGVDAALAAADLLVLPSVHETYGMVITEAAAAGIPAFVTAGTGAEEALQAGRALPSDPAAWAEALKRWLGDENERARLRAEAQQARADLPGWETTAAALLAAVDAAAERHSAGPSSPERGDWLDMRIAYDNTARTASLPLIDAALAALPDGGPGLRICDIGAGTGNSALWFDAAFGDRGVTERDWLLIDDNPTALAQAAARIAEAPERRAETCRAPIAELPRLLGVGRPVDLITGSAVLDVLRPADATALIDTLAATGAPGLFLLTITGDWHLDPVHPADAHIAAAFAAHQQREGRLGADAAGHLQTAAEAAGMTVQTTASPWQLNAADDHAFLTRFLTDRITAATEYEPASADLFADWLNDRLADASLTVTVDHRDLLILPTTPGEER